MDSLLPCPHLPQCSGCPWISTPLSDQRERKRLLIADLVERASLRRLRATDVEELVPSPRAAGYRNRAKLMPTYLAPTSTPGRNRNSIGLGLYKPGTHVVFDIPHCPIHLPLINEVAKHVRNLVRNCGIPLYDEFTGRGELRAVVIRASERTNEALVGFVTRGAECPGLEDLALALHSSASLAPSITGVVQNVNGTPGNAIFGPESRTLAGKPTMTEHVRGIDFPLGLTSFFQANTEVAELAYQEIEQALAPRESDTFLDLYCGVGAIGLCAARAAGRIIGVEESAEAIDRAREAAICVGIATAQYHAARVEEISPELLAPHSPVGRLLAAINPPRKGVSENVLRRIAESNVERMAYLSCNPKSLVRDVSSLESLGFVAVAITPFDMFPQTDQVETLAILERES